MKKLQHVPVSLRLMFICMPLVAFAQTPVNKPEDSATKDDKVVELNAFVVSEAFTSRYQADEATSATRVSVKLFDSSSTVSVLTPAFIKDVSPNKTIDSLKYISGIAESTQPVGGDRMQLRGFQTDGQVLDGFARIGPYNHLEPYLLNSVEVVKGPNAILNPSGQPGGTVNYVSKKANFQDHGEFLVQTGQYDANKVAFDVNQVVAKNVAIRVIGSVVRDRGYFDNLDNSNNVMPSAQFRWGRTNNLVIQGLFQNTHRTFVGGVPISPLASTTNITTDLWPGVAGNLNVYDDQNNPRNETGNHYNLFYTGKITDALSVRLAAHVMSGGHDAIQFTNTPRNVGGLAVTGAANISPFTGYYDPKTVWGGAPTFTATAAPTPDNFFNRSSFSEFTDELQYDVQNDYAYQVKTENVSSSTTFGFSITHDRVEYRTNNYSLPAFDITAAHVYVAPVDLGITNNGTRNTSVTQQYLSENIDLFKNRLVVSAGISNNIYRSNVVSISKNGTKAIKVKKVFGSYGVVYKPMPDVSLYYGSSQSAALNPPDVGVTTDPLQIGDQYEMGARYKFFHDRAIASVNYFHVTQDNFQVPNPGNLIFPAPVPPLPALASDRVAKGWEMSLSMEVNKSISVVGNYTTFRNRDLNGSPIRGTAEKSGAAWLQYSAQKESSLFGLSAGIGLSYSNERAGDTQNNFAQASVIAGKPVIKQPTFYLPAYYRIDLSLGYKVGRNWTAHAFVENLSDSKYLAGSLNRNAVVVGIPRNVKFDLTYSY